MTPTERLNAVTLELVRLGVSVELKESKWHWKALHYVLLVISFGQMKTFLTDFHTTIGARIGVTQDFFEHSDEIKYEVLRHELQHIKQYQRFGFGNIWFGALVVAIPYLFLPLPIGLAYCRAELEKEAYTETIRAWVQCYGRDAARYGKNHIVSQFTGSSYLWMWPFKAQIEKWFDTTLDRVCYEEHVYGS